MTPVDWVIVAAIVLSVVLAAAQGLIFEMFSLAGVVVGYLLAVWEYQRVAAWYAPYVQAAWAANLAAYVTIFFAVVVLAGMVGRIARWGASTAGLRWFDRVLGGAFGLVRGLLLVMAVLLAMMSWNPGSAWLAKSRVAPYLLVMARGAVWLAPSEVRREFRDGLNRMRAVAFGPETAKPAAK